MFISHCYYRKVFILKEILLKNYLKDLKLLSILKKKDLLWQSIFEIFHRAFLKRLHLHLNSSGRLPNIPGMNKKKISHKYWNKKPTYYRILILTSLEEMMNWHCDWYQKMNRVKMMNFCYYKLNLQRFHWNF